MRTYVFACVNVCVRLLFVRACGTCVCVCACAFVRECLRSFLRSCVLVRVCACMFVYTRLPVSVRT